MTTGVCIDLNHAGGVPEIDQIAPIGWVRQVAFPNTAVVSACQDLQADGHPLALVIAAESFAGGIPTATRMGQLAAAYLPAVWVIGNEMDAWALSAESESSWKLDPPTYADLWRLCAGAILAMQPQAILVIGGMVAGQPAILGDYLAAVRAAGGQPKGADIHPYGKTTDEARALLQGYRSVAQGLPLYVLEWWRSAPEIAAYQAMLNTETTASAFFCWSDAMVPGFGLFDVAGQPKPEYPALLAAS